MPVDVIVDIAQSDTAQEAAALLEEFATSDGASDALDTLEGLFG